MEIEIGTKKITITSATIIFWHKIHNVFRTALYGTFSFQSFKEAFYFELYIEPYIVKTKSLAQYTFFGLKHN